MQNADVVVSSSSLIRQTASHFWVTLLEVHAIRGGASGPRIMRTLLFRRVCQLAGAFGEKFVVVELALARLCAVVVFVLSCYVSAVQKQFRPAWNNTHTHTNPLLAVRVMIRCYFQNILLWCKYQLPIIAHFMWSLEPDETDDFFFLTEVTDKPFCMELYFSRSLWKSPLLMSYIRSTSLVVCVLRASSKFPVSVRKHYFVTWCEKLFVCQMFHSPHWTVQIDADMWWCVIFNINAVIVKQMQIQQVVVVMW